MLAISETALPPDWAAELLSCPECRSGLSLAETRFVCDSCGTVGRWEQGVVRFQVASDDPPVALYEALGGPTLYERKDVPFTTSSLDAPVYLSYLEELRPARAEAVIVDAGAGDGRNTEAWLTWGHRRVIATDAVLAPLARIRSRLQQQHPEWLDHLLLVQADIRRLPLWSESCDLVLAIEVLCLLGESYGAGVLECARLLKPGGRLFLSDYAFEGALFTRLMYGGLDGIVEVARTRTLPHVFGDVSVAARLLSEEELAGLVHDGGLQLECMRGLSLLAPLMGFLRGQGRIGEGEASRMGEMIELLKQAGRSGQLRRTHVAVARKPAA